VSVTVDGREIRVDLHVVSLTNTMKSSSVFYDARFVLIVYDADKASSERAVAPSVDALRKLYQEAKHFTAPGTECFFVGVSQSGNASIGSSRPFLNLRSSLEEDVGFMCTTTSRDSCHRTLRAVISELVASSSSDDDDERYDDGGDDDSDDSANASSSGGGGGGGGGNRYNTDDDGNAVDEGCVIL
jgi:hypothetical protein